MTSVSVGQAQDGQAALEGEVRLVGDVDADPLELGAAWRTVEPAQARQVAVAGDGHGHEVGHQAARGEQAEAALAVADQLAEPGDDLLLDEAPPRGRSATRRRPGW